MFRHAWRTCRSCSPDRARHEERAPGPGHRPPPGPPGWDRRFEEVADEQVVAHRIAHLGAVPAAVEGHQARPRDGGVGPLGERERTDRVGGAVDDQGGDVDPREELGQRGPALPLLHRRDEDLGSGLEPPGHPVLPRLRRVRLGEDLPDEELDEVAVVRAPVVGVEPLPSLVPLAGLEEPGIGPRAVVERQRGEHEALHPLGARGRQHHTLPRAPREADERGAVDLRGVEDGQGVVGHPLLIVAAGRAVGAAAARRIEREDPEVAAEVGNLHLPHPAVDDLPGRQEQDRALALAVLLPEDPHAVGRRESVAVRLSRAHRGRLERPGEHARRSVGAVGHRICRDRHGAS